MAGGSCPFVILNGENLKRPEYLLCGICHIGHGIVGMHSLIQGYHVPQNREKASMPSALQATASLATQPEKASTGFSYFLAILATPMGAFPITV